jgi:hypothetical protein
MSPNPRQAAAKIAAAAERKSAEQRAKEINKTVRGYMSNVVNTYKRWDALQNTDGPSPEAGQFWGAVLQNRKYDKKGRIK